MPSLCRCGECLGNDKEQRRPYAEGRTVFYPIFPGTSCQATIIGPCGTNQVRHKPVRI
jgi:hypothetical protein